MGWKALWSDLFHKHYYVCNFMSKAK